jgi:hypothetical protein
MKRTAAPAKDKTIVAMAVERAEILSMDDSPFMASLVRVARATGHTSLRLPDLPIGATEADSTLVDLLRAA